MKNSIKIGVDISECKRVVCGTAMYDMLDVDNTNSIYHKDHTVEDGLVIKESDIVRMVKMVNPDIAEHMSVRVIEGV